MTELVVIVIYTLGFFGMLNIIYKLWKLQTFTDTDIFAKVMLTVMFLVFAVCPGINIIAWITFWVGLKDK